MARASKTEIKERIDYTEELLSSALSPSRVVEILKEKYNIKDRMAWKYVSKVNDRWCTEHDKARPDRKAQLRATLEKLYHEAMKEGNKREAVQIVDKLIKLDGCYPTDKQEVSHTYSGGLDINLDSRVINEAEIRRRLEELRNKG